MNIPHSGRVNWSTVVAFIGLISKFLESGKQKEETVAAIAAPPPGSVTYDKDTAIMLLSLVAIVAIVAVVAVAVSRQSA